MFIGRLKRPRIRPGTVKSERAMGVIVSPPTGLCQENFPLSYVSLVMAKYCTYRIGSVHAVIWQAGTNWGGPVRIQILYGPEWLESISPIKVKLRS